MRDMSQITPDTAYVYDIDYIDVDNKPQRAIEAAASMENALRKLREGSKGPTVKAVVACRDITAAC